MSGLFRPPDPTMSPWEPGPGPQNAPLDCESSSVTPISVFLSWPIHPPCCHTPVPHIVLPPTLNARAIVMQPPARARRTSSSSTAPLLSAGKRFKWPKEKWSHCLYHPFGPKTCKIPLTVHLVCHLGAFHPVAGVAHLEANSANLGRRWFPQRPSRDVLVPRVPRRPLTWHYCRPMPPPTPHPHRLPIIWSEIGGPSPPAFPTEAVGSGLATLTWPLLTGDGPGPHGAPHSLENSGGWHTSRCVSVSDPWFVP